MAFEPSLRLNVTSYRVTPPHWPDGLTLKAAMLADIHACEPWMPPSRVRGIANLTNDLAPDIVFLLGDYSGGHRFVTGPVMPDDWGEALSVLNAPLASTRFSAITTGGMAPCPECPPTAPKGCAVLRPGPPFSKTKRCG
jgi:predicted MPP superfamily phosphohydrolase